MNALTKLSNFKAAAAALSLFAWLLCASVPTNAASIYLWYTIEDGKKVPNYGENPPMGVEATLVTNEPPAPSAPPAPAAAPEAGLSEQQKALKAQREEDCKYEKSRLSTLKSSGSRIRMEQEDGSSRYLTPEEINAEIKQSEDFIAQACS